MRLTLCALMCAMAFFLTGSPAGAAAEKIEMQSNLWKEAKGEALIKDLEADNKEITIHVENLVPDSVFTVWFVNERPRVDVMGVGEGANSFRTDSEGRGVFSATVPSSEIEDWQKLEVAYHPEGDPKKLANLHIALIAELDEQG
ncbi:MAG: hypothetical protein HYV23_05230 [Deltaproteobacteria bacterium]|nr:hypothetical protein [Deltaproteobacteria bacterium]